MHFSSVPWGNFAIGSRVMQTHFLVVHADSIILATLGEGHPWDIPPIIPHIKLGHLSKFAPNMNDQQIGFPEKSFARNRTPLRTSKRPTYTDSEGEATFKIKKDHKL